MFKMLHALENIAFYRVWILLRILSLYGPSTPAALTCTVNLKHRVIYKQQLGTKNRAKTQNSMNYWVFLRQRERLSSFSFYSRFLCFKWREKKHEKLRKWNRITLKKHFSYLIQFNLYTKSFLLKKMECLKIKKKFQTVWGYSCSFGPKQLL